MKIISFLITCTFLISINQIAFAQSYRFIGGENENYNIDLNFHSDSSYTLVSTKQWPKSTVSMKSILSMGSFSYKQNKYILSERINGYEMKFSIVNDSLIVDYGFKWMRDGHFVLNNVERNDSFIEVGDSMTKKSEISLLRNKLESTQKNRNPLIYDTYCFNEFFNISIDKNKKYSICIDNFIFSEGIWERKGNILLLYDNNVKGPFSLFINNDNSLISLGIPADYLMRKFTIEDCNQQ